MGEKHLPGLEDRFHGLRRSEFPSPCLGLSFDGLELEATWSEN
jgi:hypothetical protein